MSCCLYVMESMKLLFTLDKNYLPQLHVVLTSLRFNNPGESFDIYLMHRGLQDEDLERLNAAVRRMIGSLRQLLLTKPWLHMHQ